MADQNPERDGDYFSRQDSSSSSARLPRLKRTATEPFRPRLVALPTPASPTSPRTPRTPLLGRSISSNFGSPGLGFRQDDECLILEFTERYLQAGLAGESAPRGQLTFSPDDFRRAGDFSAYLPGGILAALQDDENQNRDAWGKSCELFQWDLRDVDLSLVGDKIETSLREAIRDYVLVLDDSRKRKVILIVPPTMPHPLLSIVCTKIFDIFPPPPSITLLSTAPLCAISAGLRSALVVDIGWSMTTVSAVYEYREVRNTTSSRGMKYLSWHFKEMLDEQLEKQDVTGIKLAFKDVEEVVTRLAWCRPDASSQEIEGSSDRLVEIMLPTEKPPRKASLPFEKLSEPVDVAFFLTSAEHNQSDDNELNLPFLIFTNLLALPVDVRTACLQRLCFVGNGALVPGLKSRILSEVERIINIRGWDPVHSYGSAKTIPRRRTAQRPLVPMSKERIVNLPTDVTNKDINADSEAPAYLQPPLQDPVLKKVRARVSQRAIGLVPSGEFAGQAPDAYLVTKIPQLMSEDATTLPEVTDDGLPPQLRSISSLGSWVGASMLAGLRIPGLVEIKREQFLQQGLYGRGTTVDDRRKSAPPLAHRQSLGGQTTGPGSKGGEPWSLGVWA